MSTIHRVVSGAPDLPEDNIDLEVARLALHAQNSGLLRPGDESKLNKLTASLPVNQLVELGSTVVKQDPRNTGPRVITCDLYGAIRAAEDANGLRLTPDSLETGPQTPAEAAIRSLYLKTFSGKLPTEKSAQWSEIGTKKMLAGVIQATKSALDERYGCPNEGYGVLSQVATAIGLHENPTLHYKLKEILGYQPDRDSFLVDGQARYLPDKENDRLQIKSGR